MALVHNRRPTQADPMNGTRRETGMATGSRLGMMQARFQQKQQDDKDRRMVAMLNQRQPGVLTNTGRDSSHSGTSLSESISSLSSIEGPGKVRIMFQERRNGKTSSNQSSPVGWDKSYPLEPISRNKNNNSSKGNSTKSTSSSRSVPNNSSKPPAKSTTTTTTTTKSTKPSPTRPSSRSTNASTNSSPVSSVSSNKSSNKENVKSQAGKKMSMPAGDLAECSNCGRHFAKDRVQKHKDICIKTSRKKRKVFDPTKMRVKGTEAEAFLKKASRAPPPPAKKSDWRKKHEEFINNIRAAKKAQNYVAAGGNLRDLPPPPPLDTSDYIQCPYCSRRFNETAAERHIPKCKDMIHNKPSPNRGGRGGRGQLGMGGASKPGPSKFGATRRR